MESTQTPQATSWNDTGLNPRLLELIEKAGYLTPTPVQSQAIPAAMQGRDVLVSSATGSGKTASFALPALNRFMGRDGTYILALAPTREIAQQTGAVFEQFGKELGFRVAVCIGGASIPLEKEALARSPHIIVATPGRLCDHLERGNVWLEFIQCFILDEADRMLDMGFSEQLNLISEQLPKERQTMLFSATYAPAVEKLARRILSNPVEIKIEKTEENKPKIEQLLIELPEHAKTGALMRIMREEPGTIFVFSNAKEKVSQIWRNLHSRRIYDVTYIHSDCTQEHREQAIADFKSGKYRVLIATDVAGRGIDVEDVAHVVNFDLPKEAEDYIHRIGRTGRKGKTGKSTSFATDRDDRLLAAIEKLVGAIPRAASRAQRPEGQDSRPPREDRPRDNREHRPGRGGPRRSEPRGDSPRAPREPQFQLDVHGNKMLDKEGRAIPAAPRQERHPRPQHSRPQHPRPEGEAPREPRFVLDAEGNKVLGPDGKPLIKRRRSRGGRNRRPEGREPGQQRREHQPRTASGHRPEVTPNAAPMQAKKGLLDRVLSWFRG
jgi:ATP-dependent RNA helicase RhlE